MTNMQMNFLLFYRQSNLPICDEARIKTIISHQQKYGTHWQKVKEIVDNGEIGDIQTIHATSKFWLAELGTHLTD